MVGTRRSGDVSREAVEGGTKRQALLRRGILDARVPDRLNPRLSVKQMISAASDMPNLLEGLRKAGLPEE